MEINFKPLKARFSWLVISLAIDDIDQAKLESGDLLNPASKGLLQWKDVIYFSDIFKSHFKLSENKNKIFFKSLGIATWDVSIANDIYKKYINSL